MITIDVIYLVEVERRKDEIAQAEKYRLARQLPKRHSPIREIYQRSLARLGERLVTWGYQLQTSFAAERHTNQAVASNHQSKAWEDTREASRCLSADHRVSVLQD